MVLSCLFNTGNMKVLDLWVVVSGICPGGAEDKDKNMELKGSSRVGRDRGRPISLYVVKICVFK